METVKISELKIDCYSILRKVEMTREPILVTRKGKPLARIVPASIDDKKPWLGCMSAIGQIVGDIISPAFEEDSWEVLGTSRKITLPIAPVGLTNPTDALGSGFANPDRAHGRFYFLECP